MWWKPSFALAFFVLAAAPRCAAAPAHRPPNIVFILADDLGYGDLGSFGQKRIKTPHLDRMALEGMRLVQHYSGNAVCAPSRCVLLTGLHPGHAFIRDNRAVKPEGQVPIPDNTVTLAELLKGQGYATGAFGKWGLGPPGSRGDPLVQGFDRFFGYNCQAVAHNYYPTYLWNNDRRQALDNPPFSAHQRLPSNADPHDRASYARYAGRDYAPDLIAEQALRFVRENAGRPFFLYFPTTVPHLALQVPPDSLAQYEGAFAESPYDGSRGYLPHPIPRAAYAAMISRMDREVGRLMDLIRELDLDAQTIFIFSSDNGPLYDRTGGTDCDFFESAGPLRGRKGSLYEGGFRVPAIVRWKGHIAPRAMSDRVTGFEDWLPTILELVRLEGILPAGIDGISFAPTLLGHQQPARGFLYREFPGYGGQQAVRIGDWKGVRQNLRTAENQGQRSVHTELYNLAADVGEQHDVSAEHPEIVALMEEVMRREHRPSAEFPLPLVDRDERRR
jgi:arylsulfatase A-like enzyme